jgi:MFS family permease
MRVFLLACAGFNFLAMPVFVLLPFYVNDHLGKGAEWYGFLLASMGSGSLAGFPVAGTLMKLRGGIRSPTVLLSLIATGGLISLLGWVQTSLAALLLFFLTGFLRAMFNIVVLTLFQITTPGEMRGRVMALVVAISSAASPLGMAIGGILADLMGRNIPFLYTCCGVMMAILIAAVSTRRTFREFLAWETNPEDVI